MKLSYKVECKSIYPFYELIAAFDCEAAAVGYAGECALANADTTSEYRVKHGRKIVSEWRR